MCRLYTTQGPSALCSTEGNSSEWAIRRGMVPRMEGALEAPKQCEQGTTTEGEGIIESVLLAVENANKNADKSRYI